MDEGLVKRWIAALESGEYLQGKGRLVQETIDGLRYCCLGVACVVAGLERRGEEFKVSATRYDAYATGDEFGSRLGLTQIDRQWLVAMNDDCNCAFTQIAAHISEITNVRG